MLTNFITDADLQKQYTKIMSYLPSGQTSYESKIALATELVLNELRSRSIEPRKLHIPIDLNRDYDSYDAEDELNVVTVTANGTSTKISKGMTGFRRWVISLLSYSSVDTLSVILQGSNDSNLAESNWIDIETFSMTSETLEDITTARFTVVIPIEYKSYRLKWTATGEGSTFDFNSGMYETCFDQLIIQKAFSIIYQEMSKGTDDIWYDYMKRADQSFESVMESVKFVIDSNDNQMPEESEQSGTAAIRILR